MIVESQIEFRGKPITRRKKVLPEEKIIFPTKTGNTGNRQGLSFTIDNKGTAHMLGATSAHNPWIITYHTGEITSAAHFNEMGLRKPLIGRRGRLLSVRYTAEEDNPQAVTQSGNVNQQRSAA